MNGKTMKFIPNNELSYTWRFENRPEFNGNKVVTWRFESVGKNKTKVTLRHSGFTESDRQQSKEHSQGWTWFVNSLSIGYETI